MIAYRNAGPNRPFAWESAAQPPARWHGAGEGPATYVATSPDAAWAEFLRHEGITLEEDLEGIERWLWAIEIPDPVNYSLARLPDAVIDGGLASYPDCQAEARTMRAAGTTALMAPSSAVFESASGFRSENGLVPGPTQREFTLVLYGARPDLVGWIAAGPGRPDVSLLRRVRPL